MTNKQWENYCRVCGLDQDEPIWGEDGKNPTRFICHCCGTEFGYEDSTLEGIRDKRNKWLHNPQKWFSLKSKPENWNLEEQLKQIPPQFL